VARCLRQGRRRRPDLLNLNAQHNVYNLLAHVPLMDFQKESTFDMWSTVGEYFIICLTL
jgi:hypothetical protein